MTIRSGGQILVDQLVIQGCDRIFTVPGESFLAVLDALHDTPQIDTIVCRQEGGVAYMADADGKMTGRPGVAFVTRGPGATNASGGDLCRVPDFDPDDPVRRRCRARRPRPRGLPGDRPPGVFRLPSRNGRRGSRMPRRIPEYVCARLFRVGVTAGRPGPVCASALPEDMLSRPVSRAADRLRA